MFFPPSRLKRSSPIVLWHGQNAVLHRTPREKEMTNNDVKWRTSFFFGTTNTRDAFSRPHQHVNHDQDSPNESSGIRKIHERGKRRRIERRSCVHHSLFSSLRVAWISNKLNWSWTKSTTTKWMYGANEKERKKKKVVETYSKRSPGPGAGDSEPSIVNKMDCRSHKWRLDWR